VDCGIGAYPMTAKGFAAGQISVMVKRISLFGIVSGFVLCAACAAFCQDRRAATSPRLLPDAPSARFLPQTHPLQGIGIGNRGSNEVGSPLAVTAIGLPSAGDRQAGIDWPLDQHLDQRTASALFFKHIYPSLTSPNLRYRPSDNQSLMGRATDAASWIILTRDQQGKRRFNTTYFVRLATSIVADSGSRTWRARSKTAPLSDFGSTVGNDAGMNLLHEFGPSLQQAVTSHLPRFVSRIEERILR
jgi:hypothetical protein